VAQAVIGVRGGCCGSGSEVKRERGGRAFIPALLAQARVREDAAPVRAAAHIAS